MKVNDRGTKKWTSIMLPEQVEGLRRMWAELDRKEKPILDEQQTQENEFKLRSAMRAKIEVRIAYFSEYDFHEIEGLVRRIRNDNIYIDDIELNFDDVIDVDIVRSIFDEF